MIKKPRFCSLHTKMLLVMLMGLVLSVGMCYLVSWMGMYIIQTQYMSDTAIRQRTIATAEELQGYVQENNLLSTNTDAIAKWTMAKKDVYVLFYKDQHLAMEAGWWGLDQDENMSGEKNLQDIPSVSAYPVCFRDGVFQAVIYDFSESDLYDLVNIVSIGLACGLFAVLMLLYNRQVTRSIVLISREVQQIGQGHLQLRMEPKGNDELSRLTESVETMRQSILRKTEEEQRAVQKNSDLITAMSHDIRNPLTALLGYLDLAKNGQYNSKAELQQYLDAGYEKAEQIKKLTDELFRYTLLFGGRELSMDMQEYDAMILLEQLLGEQSAAIQTAGFAVNTLVPQLHCRIRADVLYLKRVLGNLFDNVRKYANPAVPVTLAVLEEDGQLHICIGNAVAVDPGRVESNRIGLQTCEKILSQMGGHFCKYEEEGMFTAEVVLPILP